MSASVIEASVLELALQFWNMTQQQDSWCEPAYSERRGVVHHSCFVLRRFRERISDRRQAVLNDVMWSDDKVKWSTRLTSSGFQSITGKHPIEYNVTSWYGLKLGNWSLGAERALLALKMSLLWDVAPCSQPEICGQFVGASIFKATIFVSFFSILHYV